MILQNTSNTKKKGKLTIQCDELWSFVDNKGNKQWVWLGLDADTREIVGVYIGDRSELAARKLWNSFELSNHFLEIHFDIFRYISFL